MPNWVNNTIITDDQDDMQAILKLMQTEKSPFDFNALIPMPESLNITSGSSNDEDMYYYLSKRLTVPLKEVEDNPDAKLIHNMFSQHTEWLKRVKERIEEALSTGQEPSYDMGKQLIDNYKAYGATTWYEWSIQNWGSKWNACRVGVDETSLVFDTPWDVPFPIMEALCTALPDVPFTFEAWYEDDTGFTAINKNGTFTITEEWERHEEDEDY